jgi:hypothetical protein
MPDVAATIMPNATAFVLSAIEESFTAVGALSTAFDAGLAALRDATLSNRAYPHGASSSSPARIAPLGMASVSLHQALLDAHSALSSQCTVSVAECSIPDNNEPGRNLREQIARVATWMHATLDAVAATLDPSIATGTPVRTHSSSASLGFAGRSLGDQMGSAQSLTGTRIIMDDGGGSAGDPSSFRLPPKSSAGPADTLVPPVIVLTTPGAAAKPEPSRTQQPQQRQHDVAEATATVSPTRLRVAGHLASHPYSLACQQEFAIARAPTTRWRRRPWTCPP